MDKERVKMIPRSKSISRNTGMFWKSMNSNVWMRILLIS